MIDIPIWVLLSVIGFLGVYSVVVTVGSRKMARTVRRLYYSMETYLWKMASLARLIAATEDEDLIKIADEIIKSEENKDIQEEEKK